ncbi:MAG: DUF664 domain-containing protein [Armatimonadetes bacterium]|nr:DUF664 domain-containing protein [Armatimonadota bacterium]
MAQTPVQTYLHELELTRNQILETVNGLTDDQLHWQLGEDYNSVAMLIKHLTGSEKFWIGEVVGGIPSERNRAAEFTHDRPARADLVNGWLRAKEQTHAVLGKMPAGALDEEVEYGSPNDRKRTTKRWVVVHVVAHTGYHLGQIRLLAKMAQRAK